MKITKNDAILDFVDTKIEKGLHKGKYYPCPNITVNNLKDVIKFVGNFRLIDILQAYFKKNCQDRWLDFNKDIETFKHYASNNFLDGVHSMEELNAKLYKTIDTGDIKEIQLIKSLIDFKSRSRSK